MKKINSAKELGLLIENGATLETVHMIHGDLIQCNLCLEECYERQIVGYWTQERIGTMLTGE